MVTFFVIDTFWIWLIFVFTAMPVLFDLLMQKWQNETFSNLGIQYHQSDLLSKHLEILARIIKNKLEIRNQQNRAMTIRQRVRKERKKNQGKSNYLYIILFSGYERKASSNIVRNPRNFLWIFWIVNKAWIRTERKQWNKWNKQTHIHTIKKIKSRNPKTLKYKNDKPKKPITYHSVPLTRFLPSFFCPQRLLTER